MSQKVVAYLAHPVGPGHTLDELEARRENIANALSWLEWLVDHTQFAIAVPWLPYVQRLDELTYRERGIEDDLAVLARCDLVILTGGRISAGMQAESDKARALEIPVVDITAIGFHVPATAMSSATLAKRLREMTSDVRTSVRRLGVTR